MPTGDVLSYVSFFTARVVKWHTRMLEVHVERSVGVRVPPRAPSQRGRRKAVFLFFPLTLFRKGPKDDAGGTADFADSGQIKGVLAYAGRVIGSLEA